MMQRGFTAMEIVIGVAILVVAAGIAMPLIPTVIQAYRVRVAAWELAGDLRLARQKAVTTQARHRVCFTGCTDPVPTPGYLVQREEGALGSGNWNLDFSVNLSQEVMGSALTVSSTANPTFTPKGTAGGATVTLTNPSGAYQLAVAQTGRVRVCKGSC